MDSKFLSLALVFICLTGNIEEIFGQTAGTERPLSEFPPDRVQQAVDFVANWLGAYVFNDDCYDTEYDVSGVDGTGRVDRGTYFSFSFDLDYTEDCNGNDNCNNCQSQTVSQKCVARVYLDQGNPPVASFMQSGDRPSCSNVSA